MEERKICAYCKGVIDEFDKTIICPECAQVYHESCWEENSGCFSCVNYENNEKKAMNDDAEGQKRGMEDGI
ncbi:MAG: hypothetical protein GX196_03730 [Clostridiaceae bacterium]|nr:hypothetical protein [Clostridiaceae bacterium]